MLPSGAIIIRRLNTMDVAIIGPAQSYCFIPENMMTDPWNPVTMSYSATQVDRGVFPQTQSSLTSYLAGC